jgi:hypothetical protein
MVMVLLINITWKCKNRVAAAEMYVPVLYWKLKFMIEVQRF